ncbi:MAG: bifunctional DNA primase/polymerase [Chloroflexi bacterium]|nr:bifunctional DNA primase/polymerase [Chloroflexota bacterium]
MSNALFDHALAYAEKGFPVFPLLPRLKIPFGNSGGHKDATTNADTIKNWWENVPDANIGLRCNGKLVADFDGYEGVESLNRMQSEHGELPATWIIRTGGGTEAEPKEQGLQYVYSAPPELDIRPGAGKYGYAKFDIRANDSYICAVPSVTRLPYETISGSPDKLAPAPEWLIELAMSGNNGSKPTSRPVTELKPGQRHADLISFIGKWRGKGFTEAEIEIQALALNAASEAPLPDFEVLKMCAEYRPAEASRHKKEYIKTSDKGKQSLDLEALVTDLLDSRTFITLRDNEDILLYQDGYYQSGGKRFIKAECQRLVGVTPILTEHSINEVIGHIARSTYIDRKQLNQDKDTLNLVNGLLDTRTRELRPHTPDLLSTIRIPVTFDDNADCPVIKQFLTDVHHPDDIPTVEEIAGNCLTPDNSMQKAILNVGGGDQGKSTELSLLKALLGAENVSNVPWHALELNRFAMSALEGKLANIFADLPSTSLNLTSNFKMLTGGDTIGTEKKFGDYYSFVNHAKLIFSANKPPKVTDEDSYAFWRRWIIIDFPNQIAPDKKDPHILDKLTTPQELSGFLNMALDGLARLRVNGRFSYAKSVEDTTEYYLRASDPVYAFLQDCTEQSPPDYITKDDLYDAFVKYCIEEKLPVTKPNSFGRSLQNQVAYKIKATRPEVDGKRVTAWQGIKFSVRDVRDVRDFALSSLSQGKKDLSKCVLDKEKNSDIPDAIASNSLDTKTLTETAETLTETAELPDCLHCGENSWVMQPDGGYYCTECSNITKFEGVNHGH